jgi:hypothetical protein
MRVWRCGFIQETANGEDFTRSDLKMKQKELIKVRTLRSAFRDNVPSRARFHASRS